MVTLWGLLDAKPWAPPGLRVASLAYAFHFWLDRQVLQTGALTSASNAFTFGLTLVLLALIFITLSGSAAQAYFGDAHEQSKED